MTISRSIDAASLAARLSNLERCAETAPAGTYEQAKALSGFFTDLFTDMRAGLEVAGLELRIDNGDAYREVEAVVYRMILKANPGALELIAAEGFGEHVDGPAGQRVIEQAARDRDFLAQRGAVQ